MDTAAAPAQKQHEKKETALKTALESRSSQQESSGAGRKGSGDQGLQSADNNDQNENQGQDILERAKCAAELDVGAKHAREGELQLMNDVCSERKGEEFNDKASISTELGDETLRKDIDAAEEEQFKDENDTRTTGRLAADNADCPGGLGENQPGKKPFLDKELIQGLIEIRVALEEFSAELRASHDKDSQDSVSGERGLAKKTQSQLQQEAIQAAYDDLTSGPKQQPVRKETSHSQTNIAHTTLWKKCDSRCSIACYSRSSPEITESCCCDEEKEEYVSKVYRAAIFDAIKRGKRKKLKDLLAKAKSKEVGFDPLRDRDGAIVQASRFNDPGLLQDLLKMGCSVNAVWGKWKSTPLLEAAMLGHESIVRMLMEAGATANHYDTLGFSALIMSCSMGHADITLCLLEHGCSANHHSKDSRTSPLHLAAMRGQINIVYYLLHDGGGAALVNCRDSHNNSPLLLAAGRGYAEVCQCLLRYGADPNLTNDYGSTPLHSAAYRNHVHAARWLLSYEADVDAEDEWTNTPLLLAVTKNHEEMTEMLIANGAEVNHVTVKNSRRPIHYAAMFNNVECLNVLLSHHALVDVSDAEGNQPLAFASGEGHIQAVQVLLDSTISREPDLDHQNHAGMTALHYACSRGHKHVARNLLTHGASATIPNQKGQTPVQLATINKHHKLAKFLQRNMEQASSKLC